MGAPRRWRADHQVDLRAFVQGDAGLVGSGQQDPVDPGQSVEPLEQTTRVVDRSQQVEVTDRRRPAAQRPRGLDPAHARSLAQAGQQTTHHLVGVVQQESRAAAIDARDPLEDCFLRPRRETLQAPQLSLLCRRSELVDRGDAELVMQLLHRAGTHPLDAKHVEQASRHLGTQALVVLEMSRLGQLCQLGAERCPRARDVRWLRAPVPRGHVLRPAFDCVGHATVGDRLVDHLAQDLEHVRDLVEDPCELAVAEHRLAGAGRAARSRHRSPL